MNKASGNHLAMWMLWLFESFLSFCETIRRALTQEDTGDCKPEERVYRFGNQPDFYT